MLKTITTVAIALLSIASTASAQNNFTFANRTVLTPGTEQAPFVMTPRLPYQPVADTSSITCDLHLFGTSAPPSNYVYNAWYSYTPQVAGYIGVINAVLHRYGLQRFIAFDARKSDCRDSDRRNCQRHQVFFAILPSSAWNGIYSAALRLF